MSGGSTPFDEAVQPESEVGDWGDAKDWGDADEFILETGHSTIDLRLTRRQKLRRGGLGILAVAVAAFVLLGGLSSSLSWLGSLRPSARRSGPSVATPVLLGNAYTTQFPPPAGIYNNLTLKLEPANGPDGYVYSCWSGQQSEYQADDYHLHVQIYTKASRAWTALVAPLTTASSCAMVTDREREAGVLLAVWPVTITTSSVCVLPQLFHSNNAGRMWSAIPWPADIQPTCNPEFFLEAGRIYVQSAMPLLPARDLQPTSAAGFLISTDATAVSWRVADSGQANDAAFLLIALRSSGRLLAESLVGGPKGSQSGLLWESMDYGQKWQLSATLPGDSPTVSVSSDPAATDHGGWGYIYVDYFTSAAATKRALCYGALGTQGVSWVALPLPAGMDTVQAGPMVGYLPDGAEGPLESLIYLVPGETTSHTLSPLYLPLLWDTAKLAWRSNPGTLPADSIPDGVSWQKGAMTILVSVIYQSLEPALVTYSLTFSPRQLGSSK